MITTLLEPQLPLTICGIEELDAHSTAQVTHILSILDPDYPDPRAFAAYDPHHRLTLRFHDIIGPWPGWQAPEREDVEALIAFGEELDEAGGNLRHLLVHCHAGISRSTAAAIILLTQHGAEAEAAVAQIVSVRPRAWPNLRMIEIGDRMLKQENRLVKAVRRHHARALLARPELREIFTQCGRAREVDGLEAL